MHVSIEWKVFLANYPLVVSSFILEVVNSYSPNGSINAASLIQLLIDQQDPQLLTFFQQPIKTLRLQSDLNKQNEGDQAVVATIAPDPVVAIPAAPTSDEQKVLEFLRLLEDYRTKCEEEGNYLEAAHAHKQLGILKKQEEKRQQKLLRARQFEEKQAIHTLHEQQAADFETAWEQYLNEYDMMAQDYIRQLTERHAVALRELQVRGLLHYTPINSYLLVRLSCVIRQSFSSLGGPENFLSKEESKSSVHEAKIIRRPND